MRYRRIILAAATVGALTTVALLAGCVGKPPGVTPASAFDSERYLGTWHEVARLDHRFEKGLSKVTAHYSKRPDGGIGVINRGYDDAKQAWKESERKAYFVGPSDSAYLKVSFFGPFYGSYIVFDLDPGYQYAMISGPDTSYLWILSRTPKMDAATQARLVAKAKSLGFATEKLIFVAQ
jgi:apolipoprotein D and lipocalin family protein